MSDVLRTALMGTGQVADGGADLTGMVADDLVALLTGSEREEALLLRAGAQEVLRRGARLPLQHASRAEPASVDAARPSSPRLTSLVRALLAANEPELLAEAVERMTTASVRLAPELLPCALGQTHSTRREVMRPVLGERGRWLATKRSAWRWAVGQCAEDAVPDRFVQLWAEGAASERIQLLRVLRRHAPEDARKLLVETWKQEKVEQRQAYLSVIAEAPDPADESMLERMSTDRSAAVRLAAARILWRLPRSAVAQRMRERADAYVSWDTEAGRETWQIALPPEPFDPAWARDGVVELPPEGVGKRQWWLQQLIAAVDPDLWLPHPSASRAALIARHHEDRPLILDAITYAALARDLAPWMAPLWHAWMECGAREVLTVDPLSRLTPRLPADEVERAASILLRSPRGPTLLARLPRPWPSSVADGFLALCERPPYPPVLAMRAAALGMPVSLLPTRFEPPPNLAELPSGNEHARAIDQFHAIAEIRRGIAEETAHV